MDCPYVGQPKEAHARRLAAHRARIHGHTVEDNLIRCLPGQTCFVDESGHRRARHSGLQLAHERGLFDLELCDVGLSRWRPHF